MNSFRNWKMPASSFFWEQQNPKTGMVQDRCDLRGGSPGVVASIAATGFGLTALAIGEQRGFVTRSAALERLFSTLNFLWKKLPHHRGFFYHWANINTGERVWDSEISSVDTALLLCGVLTCRQHFKHPSVAQLADLIFNRVEWTWLSEDTSLLSHGWTPEIGFLPSRWDDHSELMMMYLLGIGSTAHPLSRMRGTHGSASPSNTTACDTSAPSPPYSSTNTRRLVRLPWKARQIRRLFPELGHRHGGAPPLLPGARQAVPRLLPRIFGGSPPPMAPTATSCGEAPLPSDPSTGVSCPVPRAVPCRSSPRTRFGCSRTYARTTGPPGANTGS